MFAWRRTRNDCKKWMSRGKKSSSKVVGGAQPFNCSPGLSVPLSTAWV